MLLCVQNNCPCCKKKVFQVLTMDAEMYTAVLLSERKYKEMVKIAENKINLQFKEMKHIQQVINDMNPKKWRRKEKELNR